MAEEAKEEIKKEYIPDGERITYMGSIDYRNKMVRFGIKAKDRNKHTYIIGKSGMGKSTLLENMAIQDLQNGEGLAFIDPHGSAAEKLLDFVPEHRKKDVIYFAPFDTEYPVALNVLEKVDISKRHLVANGLMASFKKVFGEEKFSDRMQYILENIILSLLETEGETLMGINRMLSDKDYRRKIVNNIQDPSVKSFWTEEFAKAGERYQQEAAPAIQNKIGQFASNPLIRNIIGQKKTSFDIREVMDNRKILIINLSKGKTGEGNANLLGSLLITKIYLAAMSRADVDPYKVQDLPPFYFYIDEFQNFVNDSFTSILSEARKYQLALTVAHQYIDQMTTDVKSAVFGNVGTMVTFRVGATDAQVFEKEFAPVFSADNIVNLSAFQMYLRLMIDSVGSKPFSAVGLKPIERPAISYGQEIIEYSRKTYGKAREEVEKEVVEWYTPVAKEAFATTENTNIKRNTNRRDFNTSRENTNFTPAERPARQIRETRQEIKEIRENREEENTKRRSRSKREKDIDNASLVKIRKEENNFKEELNKNNTSLKDAIALAMNTEKRETSIKEYEKKEILKIEEKAETEKVKLKKIEENIKEIPEKVLRDLVDEE